MPKDELPRDVEVRVRVTRELLEQLSDRETMPLLDRNGRPITVDIGEPDDEGSRIVDFTVHTRCEFLTMKAFNAACARLREDLHG